MKRQTIPESARIGPSQINAFGDRYFYNINPGTFRELSAQVLFDKQFAAELFFSNSLYFIVGTDSGLLPAYIQNKGIPDGSRYIFIEPEIILQQLIEAKALDNLDQRICYVNELEWLDTAHKLQLETYFHLNKVFFFNGLGASANAAKAYVDLSVHVSQTLSSLRYKHMILISTEPFYVEQILNLADNRYPAIDLKNAFLGKTAFILGGGPSLDQALPWLQKHRAHVVILAVSRVVRRLIQVGLEPDFIVSVDPFESNFDVCKELLLLSAKPVLIQAYHAYSKLLGQWHGRSFCLGERFPWHSSLEVNNLEIIGPTVVNAAVRTACNFGFNRIFLAGVDFSYTKDGFTHAQGSIESDHGAAFVSPTPFVETYEGEMAPTGHNYGLARDMLEQQLQEFTLLAQTQIFNISSQAAKVVGVDFMPLSSIQLDSNGVDIEAILSKHQGKKRKGFSLTNVRIEVNQALHQLELLRKIAVEALYCNEHLYSADGFIENHKEKKRLDKLEQTLKNKYRHFSRLVKAFGLRSFLQIVKPMDDDNWTTEEVKQSIRVYYESYVVGATQLIDLLNRAAAKIDARIEEEKEQPDWDLIFNNIKAEKSFGRVQKWKNDPRLASCTPEQKRTLEELEQHFMELIHCKTSAHAETFKGAVHVGGLPFSASLAFRDRKVDTLKNMLAATYKFHKQEDILPARALIQGYLAELDEDIETAMGFYQQVIEQGIAAAEEALWRIVSLDIKRGSGDLANQALACLSQIRPEYLLQYADHLRIQGRILDAIDAYCSYLAIFPNDLIIQIKLAQIYLEQKIYEGAELMIEHILAQDPNQENGLAMKAQLQDSLDGMK